MPSKLEPVAQRVLCTLVFKKPGMKRIILTFGLILCSPWASTSHADIINFIATGTAGVGLLEGNIDPPTGEVGTGGIGSTGITYDTDTNLLHVHVEWGSANGYTDLSDDVLMLHLHGPTEGAGTDAFGQRAPLVINLGNSNSFDASRTSGGVNDNYFLDEADEQGLLDGRYYVNVHLSDTDTGVIRGYLLAAVPEPGVVVPTLLTLAGLATKRRRRKLTRMSSGC